jgi:hypothetical protein
MLLWDAEFSGLFPEELVRWEFERHLSYAENTLLASPQAHEREALS